MRLRAVPMLLAIVCGFAVTAGAAPVLTVYNTRAAWEAAVTGFTEENFNTFVAGVSYEFAPVDVGDFTVRAQGSTFGFTFHNVGPDSSGNNVNGTPQINAATGPSGGTGLIFDFPIFAFGANWQGVSDARTTTFMLDGTNLNIPNINGGFFGFTSDTAFTGTLLFLSAGAPDGFGIDNAVYSRAAVPEPTTLGLLGVGLAGLYLKRKSAASK